jgi:hypothetical protein
MAALDLPPHVHGWTDIDEQPPDDHHPACASVISNECTCHHREIRMTRGYPAAKPVQLACDTDPEEAA